MQYNIFKKIKKFIINKFNLFFIVNFNVNHKLKQY